MRSLQVVIMFDIDDEATDEQIDNIVADAVVQIEEPQDNLERADFATWNVVSDWHPAAP